MEKGYYKDDFGEDILKQPFIQTDIRGTVRSFDCELHIRFNFDEGIRLWITGEYCCYDPMKAFIKIRDNSTNETLSVPIDNIRKDSIFIYNEKGFIELFGCVKNAETQQFLLNIIQLLIMIICIYFKYMDQRK